MKQILIMILIMVIITPLFPNQNTYASENSIDFGQAVAEIAAQDLIIENEDFELTVTGSLSNASGSGLYTYAVYEDARWYYDSDHRVVITDYENIIDAGGYSWGFSFSKTYIQNREFGEYQFTFIFNDMRRIHDYYGVAVELRIKVIDPFRDLCDIGGYIQSLPDSIFKNNNGNLKIALANKFCVAGKMLGDEKYHPALQKLNYDIRDKIEKWVTDSPIQEHLLKVIDTLNRRIIDHTLEYELAFKE